MEIPKFVVYKGEKFWLQSSGRYYQSGRKDAPERLLHRRIWQDIFGFVPAGYHVHHKNGDWTDNALSNLECLLASEHQRNHLAERIANGTFPEAAVGLAKAREAAKVWHASPEGIAWHVKHGHATWQKRKQVTLSCFVCYGLFLTYWSDSKFCSKSCQQKLGYQKNKTASGNCYVCGAEFFFNKYRHQENCSRACGAKSRARKNV